MVEIPQSAVALMLSSRLLPFVAACGSSLRSQAPGRHPGGSARAVRAPRAAAPRHRLPPRPPVTIPFSTLIATSERPLQGRPEGARAGPLRGGQAGIQSGGRRAARVALRRAGPSRASASTSIGWSTASAPTKCSALATGDGFTEKKYEPASIDELLALSTTFGDAAAGAGAEGHRPVGSADAPSHDIPIPLNQRVLSYIELFQGRLHDFIEEGMKRGSKYLPMIQNVFRAEGLAARPRVRAARRERVQAERAVAGEGQGRLAVHDRHGARERPAPRLVHRRAVRPRKGDASRRRSTCRTLGKHVRRRLAPRARLVQRRPRPHAARDEAGAASTTSGSSPRSRRCCRARRASTCR